MHRHGDLARVGCGWESVGSTNTGCGSDTSLGSTGWGLDTLVCGSSSSSTSSSTTEKLAELTLVDVVGLVDLAGSDVG